MYQSHHADHGESVRSVLAPGRVGCCPCLGLHGTGAPHDTNGEDPATTGGRAPIIDRLVRLCYLAMSLLAPPCSEILASCPGQAGHVRSAFSTLWRICAFLLLSVPSTNTLVRSRLSYSFLRFVSGGDRAGTRARSQRSKVYICCSPLLPLLPLLLVLSLRSALLVTGMPLRECRLPVGVTRHRETADVCCIASPGCLLCGMPAMPCCTLTDTWERALARTPHPRRSANKHRWDFSFFLVSELNSQQ